MAKWLVTYKTLFAHRNDNYCLGKGDCDHSAFVDFETRSRYFMREGVYFNEDGSIVITTGFSNKPDHRYRVSNMADHFNVRTVDELQQLYAPDGRPMPKSWVGNHAVVVDYDHNRVLMANNYWGKIRYETPDGVPSGTHQFLVGVPDQKAINKARKELAPQRTAAIAAARMHGIAVKTRSHESLVAAVAEKDLTSDETVQWTIGIYDNDSYNGLLRAVYTKTEEFPYLMLHP